MSDSAKGWAMEIPNSTEQVLLLWVWNMELFWTGALSGGRESDRKIIINFQRLTIEIHIQEWNYATSEVTYTGHLGATGKMTLLNIGAKGPIQTGMCLLELIITASSSNITPISRLICFYGISSPTKSVLNLPWWIICFIMLAIRILSRTW